MGGPATGPRHHHLATEPLALAHTTRSSQPAIGTGLQAARGGLLFPCWRRVPQASCSAYAGGAPVRAYCTCAGSVCSADAALGVALGDPRAAGAAAGLERR
jgi:hypothetical protein